MSIVFLNGKEIQGNETLKEGDCLVCVDNIEGTVYKFQSGISWTGVNKSFKEKVIKAMCELYCDYKKQFKTWRILEISSTYRTEREQAVAMVDHILVKGQNKLTDTYTTPSRKNPLTLIPSLYYEGNHLGCGLTCMTSNSIICKYGKMQQAILEGLPQKEQEAFYPYFNTKISHGNINLKNNKDKIKNLLEAWIKASGFKSHHQLGLALDFSSNTPTDQREDLLNLLESEKYRLSTSKYDTGNFHVSQK